MQFNREQYAIQFSIIFVAKFVEIPRELFSVIGTIEVLIY